MQNLYGQAKDAARDVSDAAVDYAKGAYENSGDSLRDGSQAVARKVQDNPLGALLVAGGIGFALAMLMTRPPRRAAVALALLKLSPPYREDATRIQRERDSGRARGPNV